MQAYLEEAEKDKERYMKELEVYQQTDAYKNFVARQKAMKKGQAAFIKGTFSIFPVKHHAYFQTVVQNCFGEHGLTFGT